MRRSCSCLAIVVVVLRIEMSKVADAKQHDKDVQYQRVYTKAIQRIRVHGSTPETADRPADIGSNACGDVRFRISAHFLDSLLAALALYRGNKVKHGGEV